MTIEEAISRLKELQSNDDNEAVHVHADYVLLQLVPPEVRDAYIELQDEVIFWYA